MFTGLMALIPLSVNGKTAHSVSLTIVQQWDAPVIDKSTPGTETNKYGFEGGCVVKWDGAYHLFTSEMAGDPHTVKMRLAHWVSEDRLHWRRVGTLYESSGNHDGTDPRASLWAPMPVFSRTSDRWELFYVAYRSKPDAATAWYGNYRGEIWRAVSEVKGRGGIGGPYRDVGVILKPGPGSEPWEGLQGVDSFYPYRVGKEWYGFYGSAQTQYNPIRYWGVGLAKAPDLAGPWKRCSGPDPLPIAGKFMENPIVTHLRNGPYIAVFDVDVDHPDSIGYSVSSDGIHWSKDHLITLRSDPKLWVERVRTPLGLIPEGHGIYTLFYTGFAKPNYGGYDCVGAA